MPASDIERPLIIVGRNAMALLGSLRAQLGDLTVEDDVSLAHDRDVVADLLHLGHVMRAEQHRQPARGEPLDQRPHVTDARRIETVRWLVDDQQLRTPKQARGQPEALHHPIRVAAHPVIRAVCQIDDLQHLVHPIAGDAPSSRASPARFSRPVKYG